MFSSKITRALYKGSVRSAEALDKLAGKVITAVAVKHIDTMFKEAHKAEDKADAAFEQADVLQAAAEQVRTEAISLDFDAGKKLREAEQEALELGVDLSRWA